MKIYMKFDTSNILWIKLITYPQDGNSTTNLTPKRNKALLFNLSVPKVVFYEQLGLVVNKNMKMAIKMFLAFWSF